VPAHAFNWEIKSFFFHIFTSFTLLNDQNTKKCLKPLNFPGEKTVCAPPPPLELEIKTKFYEIIENLYWMLADKFEV